MSIKRLGLILLTLVSFAFSASALWDSLQKPQFQNHLELYQTNIVLQAATWEPPDSNDGNFKALRDAVLVEKPLENATKQYQEARKLAQPELEKAKNQLAKLRSEPITTPTTPQPKPEIPPATNTSRLLQQQQLQQSLNQLQKLDLYLGILQARQGQTDTAQKTWGEWSQSSEINPQLVKLTHVLTGLWSTPPRIMPDAERLIQDNLEGWFRFTTLSELYQLQQRQQELVNLKAAQQEVSQQALLKLVIIGTVPVLAALIGVGLLIFLVGQRLLKGKESLLAENADLGWSTPWNGETILQVFVLGFFLMGQILVPLLFSLVFSFLPIPRPADNVRIQAFYVLVSYLVVASGALLVLYLSIKSFFPLPESWFRFSFRGKWFLWGLGGYCVALPIVVVVSLINQQLWQGQGGSNPLLQLALEGQDTVALGIFFFTAAIAAPLFEEFLFRGFLLPSLTRYLPVWGSILISSFLFAVAHLSLSEIFPLFALGVVLGVVYTRSRNLLASMLLHSLWNSGTLLSLFILGSSN
ncbi:MAG: CPBP family intramembrane metalloprotease [Stigonema ocellatum SAG 48.90 = DSM 106950]|nr:CPBP family intramembrane metalloprotease [Stigonema ocellatum SAG 48.90 = DSM 106950]